jgi:hypothetical protein
VEKFPIRRAKLAGRDFTLYPQMIHRLSTGVEDVFGVEPNKPAPQRGLREREFSTVMHTTVDK